MASTVLNNPCFSRLMVKTHYPTPSPGKIFWKFYLSTTLNCEHAACHFLPYLFVHLFQQSPFYAYTLLLVLPQRLKVIRKRHKDREEVIKDREKGSITNSVICTLVAVRFRVKDRRKVIHGKPCPSLSNLSLKLALRSSFWWSSFFLWAIQVKTLQAKLLSRTLCSVCHVAPTDLSQCFWLVHLQVTHSNHALASGTAPEVRWSSSPDDDHLLVQQLEPRVYEQEQMFMS